MRKTLITYLAATLIAVASVPILATPAQAAPTSECRYAAIRSVDNGRYVKADWTSTGDLYGRLRAISTAIGDAERYQICQVTGAPAPTPGTYWTIRSMANLRYVTAEFTYSGWLTGLLRAGSATVGPYERFTFAGWTGNIGIRSISFNLPVVLDTAPAEVAGNLRARTAFRSPPRTWTLVFDNLCRDTGCNYYDPYEVGCAANAVEVAAVQALDGTTTTAKIFSSTLCPGFSWAQGTESALSNAPPTNALYSLTFSQSESPTGPATSYTEMLCCVAPASGANTPMAPDSLWVWACIQPYESTIPEACTTRH